MSFFKKIINIFKRKNGQSMVEVLITLTIVTLCFVALVVVVVIAVRNARFANNSALANRYAQEGIEVVRLLRDQQGWPYIAGLSGDQGLDKNLNLSSGCGSANIDGFFTRCINFAPSGSPVDTSEVTVTVLWAESRRSHSVVTVTRLTKWN